MKSKKKSEARIDEEAKEVAEEAAQEEAQTERPAEEDGGQEEGDTSAMEFAFEKGDRLDLEHCRGVSVEILERIELVGGPGYECRVTDPRFDTPYETVYAETDLVRPDAA